MNDRTEDTERQSAAERHEFFFQHLVAMFQALALQQLGKLVNPITGEAARDLRQARITIDMIEMIRAKTAGNLSDDERRLLEAVLLELQMNYVDEAAREAEEKPADADEPAPSAEERPPDA